MVFPTRRTNMPVFVSISESFLGWLLGSSLSACEICIHICTPRDLKNWERSSWHACSFPFCSWLTQQTQSRYICGFEDSNFESQSEHRAPATLWAGTSVSLAGYSWLEVFTEIMALLLFMGVTGSVGYCYCLRGLWNGVIGMCIWESFSRCEKYSHWRAQLTQYSPKHLPNWTGPAANQGCCHLVISAVFLIAENLVKLVPYKTVFLLLAFHDSDACKSPLAPATTFLTACWTSWNTGMVSSLWLTEEILRTSFSLEV